jgi:hypothetical protein
MGGRDVVPSVADATRITQRRVSSSTVTISAAWNCAEARAEAVQDEQWKKDGRTLNKV